jgi:hypothetical protein
LLPIKKVRKRFGRYKNTQNDHLAKALAAVPPEADEPVLGGRGQQVVVIDGREGHDGRAVELVAMLRRALESILLNRFGRNLPNLVKFKFDLI